MDALTAAGVVCGALLSIAAVAALAWRRIRRVWKRIDAFLEDWNGTPARPGRRRVPSMPERVAELEHDVASVKQQVTPNGGDSRRLGDRIVRVERALGTEPDQQEGPTP